MRFIYIAAAILLFGILIIVHEFGHFIAAKLCGVRVFEFSIGMGPELWSRTAGETQYSLRALPLGGFCAMAGEDAEAQDDERALSSQSFWKQFLILSAGSLMNFLTGFLIVLFLFSGASAFYTDAIVGLAPEVSADAGLMPGDRIYKVNGYRTYLSGDASMFLQYSGDSADLEVVRDGKRIKISSLPRQTCTSSDGSTYQGFGLFVGVEEIPATLAAKLKYSWYQSMDFVQMVWFSLRQLFSGIAGVKLLSGPVGIVSTISEVGVSSPTTADAWRNIFYLGALVAVNLSVMNLLPLPALDGGRIFFLLVNAVALLLFRRKVPERYQSAINTAGFVALMGLMLLITLQDVYKLIQ